MDGRVNTLGRATLNLVVLMGCAVMGTALGSSGAARGGSIQDAPPYGLTSRVAPPAYLRMPHRMDGKIPALLSQTGAFKDVRNLGVADGLIPYDLIVCFLVGWGGQNALRRDP